MKQITIIVLAILLSSSISLFGQFQKNTLMVGGSADLGLQTSNPAIFEIDLRPTLGFFPVENFAIGMQLNADFTFMRDGNYSSLGLGPIVRYYIGKQKLTFFGHFSYLGRWRSAYYMEEGTFYQTFLPGVGMNYMLTPAVGLESMLGLYLGEGDPTFSLSFGFQIFIPPGGS